ncbi:MAG: polyphosphate kinase 1, partial [Peptoniphilaceae bacterium]|nr:polyphosphate kinase 1 [Peptoniphilaceae bacterium]
SFLLIEDLILSKTQEIFSDYTIISKNVITITRNFDYSDEYDRYDEFEDYKAYMKEIIKKRKRQNPVRLEIQGNVDEDTLNFLLNKNHLDFERCFYSISPLVTNFLFNIISEIPSAIKNKLLYKDFESSSHIKNTASNMISSVQKNDMLLFYPFDDVDDFINLLKEASEDENCIDIKITVYRLAENSKIVKYLARAAENGKNVTVLMELKARFDEERNIKYSNILYESGCNIIYGFPEYKTHSKVCLLTFIDKNFNNSYITQIGTGNYNESTSRQYTDISFITSNYEIGLDAMDFFKNISIGNLNGKYAHLLQSPYSLKQTFLKLIDEEIKKGKDGFIFAKFNSLTDIDFLKKLQLASENSVEIKLIVRGICCILPKVENKTENIEIHSIVGRFLEHSRVYIFGKGKNSKVFISSADLMTRNMERRVEIACPIYDEILKDKLFNYLNICFKDNIKGRVLCNDGEYRKIKSYDEQISSQDFFIEMAKKYSQNSNLKRDEKLMENDIKKTEKNKFDELKNLSFIEKLKILFFN